MIAIVKFIGVGFVRFDFLVELALLAAEDTADFLADDHQRLECLVDGGLDFSQEGI